MPVSRGTPQGVLDDVASALEILVAETLQMMNSTRPRLYVGNLSYQVDSSELQQLFAQHGTVTSAQVINDRDTGRSKGFGFVEMATEDAARAAIEKFNETEVDGRRRRITHGTSARVSARLPGGRRRSAPVVISSI